MKYEVSCDNSKRLGVPVIHHANDFEHSLIYNRADGSRVEIALVHVPGGEPVFVTAIIPTEDNPNGIPSHIIELSLDELRVRLAFENHLNEAGLLG